MSKHNVHHYAHPDPGRLQRQGFPEIIYCPGKTIEQIVNISKRLYDECGIVICSRAEEAVYKAVKKPFKKAVYHKAAKMVVVKNTDIILQKNKSMDYVCVVTAGTTDIPVAEEASVMAETLGSRVERVFDVGVAGVHRLFEHQKKLDNASCVVVCAGMEGALPSILGGIVSCPVIGVPTSVGYGSNLKGFSALLAMLNSCAVNVCVVNIDDGIGAGVIAHLINKKK
ncbi:MAG: hypothetical protein A2252_11035 [Elusimicrobia bacterium RIFOXYA2_FULL_39_19]|nr:MAG: hypothetical protein A2252_11035 [Elusimicrobia bacterium RIFOXYA2_FULL_39_19]